VSSTPQSAETTTTARDLAAERPSSWSLWTRQVLAIMRLEIGKNFLGRRALLLYPVAALPIFLMAMLTLVPPEGDVLTFGHLGQIYAGLYGGLILRTLVFFGCAWMFMNLFRGEVVDRSLHYYFLSPVRREVLVVGKYLSGLLAAMVIFSVTTVASMLVLYFGIFPSESSAFFVSGAGTSHLLSYFGVTLLACVGYGAVFLMMGLIFRNPIVPGLVLYGWEWINFLLPPGLKKVSVIHYLTSLVPVSMSEGPFAVLAEPTPAWISVPSLFVFTAVVLVLAGWHARRMEISYAGDCTSLRIVMPRLLPLFLAAALLIAGTSACGPPSSSQGSPSSAPGEATPELTDEVIHERINDARVYDIPPEEGNIGPNHTVAWSFDFDEPKEITIISREVNGNSATVVMDIKTRTNPQRRGPARYVAGQIRTDWRLETGWVLRRWEIVNTENISMKYRDDPPPAPPPPGASSPTR